MASRVPFTWIDHFLVVLFCLGIYSGLAIKVAADLPVPSTIAGVAGLLMLVRRRHDLTPGGFGALLLVLLVYLVSILSAENANFLSKRFTGLIQISYSLTIAYGLFLTLTAGRNNQVANTFLFLALLILAGALAEQYLGLRPISDAFRMKVYDRNYVYDSDFRDILFYGRIRPKVFASEPSSVTFGYTLFSFAWVSISSWRWKMPLYVGVLFPIGLAAMPGPTLLMMLVLCIPLVLFAPGTQAALSPGRLIKGLIAIAVIGVVASAVATNEFSNRIYALTHGQDASFFYREVGPFLVALDVFKQHPWAGGGLTGEFYLQNEVTSVFMQSAEFSSAWTFADVRGALTNYFWLHWIYLGLVFGIAAFVALTHWLKCLGVSAILFSWAVWAVLGQTAGGYVAPTTWAVLLLAASASVLQVQSRTARQYAPSPPLRALHPHLSPGMAIALQRP